jgi:hypothetical protein
MPSRRVQYFDAKGLITFETLEELGQILAGLDTEEKRSTDYELRKEAIQRNFDIAMAVSRGCGLLVLS